MATISLCMIVKNEEEVLERCLQSVDGIFDEIIILDTGSQDRTKEIANRYTKYVYDYHWIDDFAAARNASFDKASMDYVMWLDADDILLEKDFTELLELKKTLDPSIHMVMMKYHVSFDEQGNPTMSYFRERLMKRDYGYQWQSPIHEVITPSGNIIYSPIAITHRKLHSSDPDRNLRIFQKMLTDHKELDSRQRFYYARELYYHAQYEEAILEFTEFLNMDQGWLEDKVSACRDLGLCYAALKQPQEQLAALCRSFLYDTPRAEILCDIGNYFFEHQQYTAAIFWYQSAASIEYNSSANGFCSPDCHNFIPYIQLCVCYDKLGHKEKALEYHLKSRELKPENTAVKLNENYFYYLKSQS